MLLNSIDIKQSEHPAEKLLNKVNRTDSAKSRIGLMSLFLAFLFLPGFINAQNDGGQKVRWGDTIYKDYIKSLQIRQVGWKFSPPLIALHSGDVLQLDFDD